MLSEKGRLVLSMDVATYSGDRERPFRTIVNT